jgi:SAM-dependent methyltransferase
MEAADFYTGLVAELYAALRSSDPDPAPYARFVERSGTPALELGCGDGDPLLALRAQGLDVEGLDASEDMLDRCRRRASDLGIGVTLHHATFEDMDLGRTYRSMYLAGATFCLLPDDAAARRALQRIAAHLEPGGRVLVPLFVPARVPADAIGAAQERHQPDGTVLRCTTVAVERDETARRQVALLRYERVRSDGTHEQLERHWLIHWYTQEDFAALATDAGLTVGRAVAPDGTTAGPDAREWSVVLTRP